jgi:hypothetical protein
MSLFFIAGLISVGELAHRAGRNLIYNARDLKVLVEETKYEEDSSKQTARSINDTSTSINDPLNEDN